MLAHVHIMKTAGQTIRGILRQSFTGQHCDLIAGGPATEKDVRWARRFYPQLKSIAGHCVLPHGNLEEAGSDLRYFTFLRDPVQRCASHYQFSMERRPDRIPFETWLLRNTNYTTRVLTKTDNAQQAIEILEKKIGFVGFVERFNESLVLMERWCDDPEFNIRYQSVNIAPDNRIKNEILNDARSVAMILECHQADQVVVRYAREVIYPRQVKAFGPELPALVQELEESLPGPTILSFTRFVATAKRNILYKPFSKYVRRAA
jgi:hypothetical protein